MLGIKIKTQSSFFSISAITIDTEVEKVLHSQWPQKALKYQSIPLARKVEHNLKKTTVLFLGHRRT